MSLLLTNKVKKHLSNNTLMNLDRQNHLNQGIANKTFITSREPKSKKRTNNGSFKKILSNNRKIKSKYITLKNSPLLSKKMHICRKTEGNSSFRETDTHNISTANDNMNELSINNNNLNINNTYNKKGMKYSQRSSVQKNNNNIKDYYDNILFKKIQKIINKKGQMTTQNKDKDKTDKSSLNYYSASSNYSNANSYIRFQNNNNRINNNNNSNSKKKSYITNYTHGTKVNNLKKGIKMNNLIGINNKTNNNTNNMNTINTTTSVDKINNKKIIFTPLMIDCNNDGISNKDLSNISGGENSLLLKHYNRFSKIYSLTSSLDKGMKTGKNLINRSSLNTSINQKNPHSVTNKNKSLNINSSVLSKFKNKIKPPMKATLYKNKYKYNTKANNTSKNNNNENINSINNNNGSAISKKNVIFNYKDKEHYYTKLNNNGSNNININGINDDSSFNIFVPTGNNKKCSGADLKINKTSISQKKYNSELNSLDFSAIVGNNDKIQLKTNNNNNISKKNNNYITNLNEKDKELKSIKVNKNQNYSEKDNNNFYYVNKKLYKYNHQNLIKNEKKNKHCSTKNSKINKTYLNNKLKNKPNDRLKSCRFNNEQMKQFEKEIKNITNNKKLYKHSKGIQSERLVKENNLKSNKSGSTKERKNMMFFGSDTKNKIKKINNNNNIANNNISCNYNFNNININITNNNNTSITTSIMKNLHNINLKSLNNISNISNTNSNNNNFNNTNINQNHNTNSNKKSNNSKVKSSFASNMKKQSHQPKISNNQITQTNQKNNQNSLPKKIKNTTINTNRQNRQSKQDKILLENIKLKMKLKLKSKPVTAIQSKDNSKSNISININTNTNNTNSNNNLYNNNSKEIPNHERIISSHRIFNINGISSIGGIKGTTNSAQIIPKTPFIDNMISDEFHKLLFQNHLKKSKENLDKKGNSNNKMNLNSNKTTNTKNKINNSNSNGIIVINNKNSKKHNNKRDNSKLNNNNNNNINNNINNNNNIEQKQQQQNQQVISPYCVKNTSPPLKNLANIFQNFDNNNNSNNNNDNDNSNHIENEDFIIGKPIILEDFPPGPNPNLNNLNNLYYTNSNNNNNINNQDNSPPSMTSTLKESCYYQNAMSQVATYIKAYRAKKGEYPETKINFYKYGRVLGKGAFGKVNIALHLASGRLVAIKSFNKKKLTTRRAKRKIRTEIEALSKLRSPFCTQIYDSFETETHILIIMEYVCGDLLGYIRKRAKISEPTAKIIFKQIIKGLQYIHKKKIVHRDIKLDNVLIDLTNTVKICDFGVSKILQPGDVMYEHCGTPAYIAPEIFRDEGYEGFACDIWSAGVTLYYMLAGTQPFKSKEGKIEDLKEVILKGKYDKIEEVSEEANDLINGMLNLDPKKRLTVDEILKHPWLKHVNIKNRENLNIFTNAEKCLLSKYDVNYLCSPKEELIEAFSDENLETKEEKEQKGDTKSDILAPYNSYALEEGVDFYHELKVENEICRFNCRAQLSNIKYELSNNQEFDNGIIKTQYNSFENLSDDKKNTTYNEIPQTIGTNNLSMDSMETFNGGGLSDDIIKDIEQNVGYDRKYLIQCLKKNEINYATATYYLMMKDEMQ